MSPASADVGLDHITVTVDDLTSAARFFDAVLEPLGLSRLVDYEDPEDEAEAGVEAIGYGVEAVELWIVVGRAPTTGLHVAFAGPGRGAVDSFYTAGLAVGATSEHLPRSWQIYRSGRYSAMLRDPAGNIIEAFTDHT